MAALRTLRRTLCIAVAATGLFGGAAWPQATTDRDIGSDLRRERQQAVPSPPAGEPVPGQDLRIELTMPFLYTSNAVRANTETLASRKGDRHFNPDLLLGWSHQYSQVKLSASADLSVDRYLKETDADEDTVFIALKAALTDGRSDLFVPYVRYDGTMDFLPTFARRDDTLHDLALGFSSGIGFDAAGRRIAYADAVEPGNSSIAIDVRAGRRLSDPKDFENTFVTLAVDLSYVHDRAWRFTLSPKFRMRWYDSFFGEFRRDYRPSAVLQATWTPDWLTASMKRAEIDFTVTFLRNISTVASERFGEWDVGPQLVLAWRF